MGWPNRHNQTRLLERADGFGVGIVTKAALGRVLLNIVDSIK